MNEKTSWPLGCICLYVQVNMSMQEYVSAPFRFMDNGA